jgi:large repetitive protein
VTDDNETLAGAVSGTGTFTLASGSTLQLDSSVSPGETVAYNGSATLGLSLANEFSGTISGFGTGDAIDAQNFQYGSTSINFLENSQGTGGTLTLTDGSLVANISMTGSYTTNEFQPNQELNGGTGTLIKFMAS